MKVCLSFGLVVLLCAFAVETAWAHLPVSVSPKSDDGLVDFGWTPIQLGIYPSRPLQVFPGTADVYGVATGLVSLRQSSAIVSFSLGNTIQNNYLFQAGLFNGCELNLAFEAGLFNFTGRNFGINIGLFNIESNFGERSRSCDPYPWLPGLQIGLFNAGGGIQIGLLNYNPQGFLPCFPLFNFPWGVD